MKLIIEYTDGSDVTIVKKVTKAGMKHCLDWFAENDDKPICQCGGWSAKEIAQNKCSQCYLPIR